MPPVVFLLLVGSRWSNGVSLGLLRRSCALTTMFVQVEVATYVVTLMTVRFLAIAPLALSTTAATRRGVSYSQTEICTSSSCCHQSYPKL